MGCDIHTHVEMQASDGSWTRAEDVIDNPYYEPGESYLGNTPTVYDEWYQGRNYALFGVLAGVRGGRGIVEPRGLPEDRGLSVKTEYNEGACDWHSASWYSLQELESNLHVFNDPAVYGHFANDVIVRMRDLADEELEGNPNRVRFVFWFDN